MKTIKEIMQLQDSNKIQLLLTARKKPFSVPLEQTESQYDPYKHKVMSSLYRKKKVVKVNTGKTDPMTGEPIYKEKKVDRVRVAIPVQRTIVERSVGFLFSIPVEYRQVEEAKEESVKLFNDVNLVLKQNKIKFFDKKLARTLFRERECAELWFFVLDDEGKPKEMRVKLLSPTKGDKLYPHFDDYDRMDAFAREYTQTDEMGKTTTRFDVYTDKFVYRYANDGTGLVLTGKPKQHGFTKIPVVYYRQEETEWHCVQPVIERIEELLSNWGDTNDYFGSPSYFFKGKLSGFAEKGEQGKVYQGSGEGADMKVLSWDSSPASITGELANLFNIVFSYTQTPDISFENMKTLGGNTSGVAIKLMFTDPHMKAEVKVELFGEMFTRRFNVVLNGFATLNGTPDRIVKELNVEPVFKPYMPKNEKEEIEIISISTGGKPTMSQEDGIRQNPRVKNPDETMRKIQEENMAAMMTDAFGQAE